MTWYSMRRFHSHSTHHALALYWKCVVMFLCAMFELMDSANCCLYHIFIIFTKYTLSSLSENLRIAKHAVDFRSSETACNEFCTLKSILPFPFLFSLVS